MNTPHIDAEDGDVTVRECIDCRKPWELADTHRAWFLANGLQVPRRCPRCRAAKRAAQATQQ
jgi:hypothetical protein